MDIAISFSCLFRNQADGFGNLIMQHINHEQRWTISFMIFSIFLRKIYGNS
jgi:hypothetical protein